MTELTKKPELFYIKDLTFCEEKVRNSLEKQHIFFSKMYSLLKEI